MAGLNIGINGFGRIGRCVYRAIMKRAGLEQNRAIQVVAINDLVKPGVLAHLLKYDSVHGNLKAEVRATPNGILVNGEAFNVFSEKDPSNIPWGDVGAQIVIESTGFFRKVSQASAHLAGGAEKVIISAPAKDECPTVVMRVNEFILQPEDKVVSNASCTTNCLAPVAMVLENEFGIESGLMTTIHAYTGDQRLIDAPHDDLRRARAAAINMNPTTTGAARAVGKVLPQLEGKLDGGAMRVPVADGSIVDLSVNLKVGVTAEAINAAMKAASELSLKGILQYSEEELVSSDVIGNPHSSIFDSLQTKVLKSNPKFAKVFSWYDNEMGYSHRLVDLALYMASL